MSEDIEFLRFPIGRFNVPETISENQINNWITEMERLPAEIHAAAGALSDSQLDTPYRTGGWTIRQVVHHLPDSHLNAYIRFKLAVTEDNPVIRPYREDRWAACSEAKYGPVDSSIVLLQGLHMRWVAFLRTLTGESLNRTYVHPEHATVFRLKEAIGMYAWHGKHHLAHITETVKRNRWER